VKAVHVDRLGVDFPHIQQAIKLTRWRHNNRTGKIGRETVYVITSLTSAEATPADLARLAREHWSVEVEHQVSDVSFGEDASTSRTGHGPTTSPPSAPASKPPSRTPATCTSPKAAATTPP
jgi:hypothetical protein